MNNEVNPCVFCGGTDIKPYTYREKKRPMKIKMYCRDCHRDTNYCFTLEDATAAWNKRNEVTIK